MMPMTMPNALMAFTVIIAEAVAVAATERSKMPAMIQSVRTVAMMKRIDDWSRMFAAFCHERNEGEEIARTTKSNPKTPTIP